jgi:hypothetical protein
MSFIRNAPSWPIYLATSSSVWEFIELEQSGAIDAGTGLRKQRLGYHDGAAIEETV